MSFPKAKLHRFNDEISCTPSPGKYDPKFDNKVRGVVIEKSRRFQSPNMHSSTESLESITSASGAKFPQAPVFRTPQLKRKVLSILQNRSRSQSQSERVVKSRNIKEEHNIENLREENTRLKTEINAMKEELAQQTSRMNEDFNAKVTDYKILIEEKNKLVISQSEDIKNINQTLKEFCESMKTEREDYTKYIKDLELKNNEIPSLQENLKIANTELENVKKSTNELSQNFKEAFERSKFLYQELCKVETERDNLVVSDLENKKTIVEIQEKCNDFETNMKIARDKCKKYEVSVSKMQETIKALSDRLFASESDVERLNKVESDLKSQKSILEKKARILMEDGLELRKNMESMEQEIVEDVMRVKNDLFERLELIKNDAQNEISFLKEEIKLRDQDIVNKSQSMLDFTIKIESLEDSKRRTDHFIGIVEMEKKDLEVQLFEMTEKHFKLESQAKEKDEKIENLLNKFYEQMTEQELNEVFKVKNLTAQIEQSERQIKYLEEQLIEKEKTIKELETRHEEKVRLLDPSLLISLQERIQQLEEQNAALIESLNSAQKEVKELDHQLAQLIGHQNIKQKIKHVDQLKQQNRLMKEEIDKLVAELNREKKKNKENSLSESPKIPRKVTTFLTPSGSLNTSSPILKDRNQ